MRDVVVQGREGDLSGIPDLEANQFAGVPFVSRNDDIWQARCTE